MKLIIGLGNPGVKYSNNRHNTGHLVVDHLKEKNLSGIKLLKADSFMNDSGKFVKGTMAKQKGLDLSSVYIVHDDLDIPLGSFKIQFGRGPKDHNGIIDIEEKLGTKDFWRIRVGIENRGEEKVPGEVYALSDFTSEELSTLDGVMDEICKKLVTL